MVVEIDGGGAGRRVPEPIRWLLRLQAVWEDQRADAAIPDADDLYLADLAALIPHLLLTCRDEESGGSRVEFAGAAATALLGVQPVGETPEVGPREHPLAWIGAGIVRARRPAMPGPCWLRFEGRLGLFLPYGGADGRVTLVVAGLAAWPLPQDRGDGADRVVPMRPAPGPCRRGPTGGCQASATSTRVSL